MIEIAARGDGSPLAYRLAPNLPATSVRRSRVQVARSVIRAWSPLRPEEFASVPGQERTILRLAYVLAWVFRARTGLMGCDEVRAGKRLLVKASPSLFGQGYYDVEIFGLGLRASWLNAGRPPLYPTSQVRRFTETTLGILGAVASARTLIRQGRHRSRLAALIFYHVTSRPLAFVDRVLASLGTWAFPRERELLLLLHYLRQVYGCGTTVTLVPSHVRYANGDVRDFIAEHPEVEPVQWCFSLPPKGPVVAVGPRRWREEPRAGCYEVVW